MYLKSAKPLFVSPADGLTRLEIGALLENLSRATVAVVGDFCLDSYWTVDRSASETSVETGLKTEPVRRQRSAPGGAGNVVMNLLELGVRKIYPVGVLGEDVFGRELRRLLDHPYVHCRGLITQGESWATHTYVKPHVDGNELNRIDFGNYNTLSEMTEEKLLEALAHILPSVAVVLINHQVIGSLHDSASFRQRLADMVKRFPDVCFVVDSRGYHGAYPPALHKLNEREVLRACGISCDDGDFVALDDLLRCGTQLQERWSSPLIVTRGARGCIVFADQAPRQIFGVQLAGRSDPVGAGDTFVSTLAAVISTGANLMTAAFISNLAAAVTAQKLFQTGTAAPQEILELGSEADYVYRPELAEAPQRAVFFEDSEIEIVADPLPKWNIKHAIFDHDGTISTLREGWELIMEPMMIKSVLGKRHREAEEGLYNRVRERVGDFIERTTGIQTITQMMGLVDLVKEFGVVPEAEVLTASEYKAIYNEELKALVASRLSKLDRQELEVSDFTLKGAVSFLHELHKSGVILYLASGTDEEDVKEEALRLGYAHLFEGRIYGSVGRPDKDAKKIVIERILAEINGDFHQLVAFGDGPVEMRETARRGGCAVGLASDEVRRFGGNKCKRRRLIQAGAQIVVPDFSQWTALWKVLGLSGCKD